MRTVHFISGALAVWALALAVPACGGDKESGGGDKKGGGEAKPAAPKKLEMAEQSFEYDVRRNKDSRQFKLKAMSQGDVNLSRDDIERIRSKRKQMI